MISKQLDNEYIKERVIRNGSSLLKILEMLIRNSDEVFYAQQNIYE